MNHVPVPWGSFFFFSRAMLSAMSWPCLGVAVLMIRGYYDRGPAIVLIQLKHSLANVSHFFHTYLPVFFPLVRFRILTITELRIQFSPAETYIS